MSTFSIVEERELLEIEDLEIAAKGLVDGFLAGLNKSVHLGQNSEFVSHRDYAPGDNIRHINWNIWARTDHLFVKEFETDFNHCVYISVDSSNSMSCANAYISKWQFACKAAAALAYLAVKRNDAPSLIIENEKRSSYLEPAVSYEQFYRILGELAAAEPAGAKPVNSLISKLPYNCRNRGIVIVISDFFDNEDEAIQNASTMISMGHEVIFVQIFDPWEAELTEEGFYRFHDLETFSTRSSDVHSIVKKYREIFTRWHDSFTQKCSDKGIDLISLKTTDSLTDVLSDYLDKRESCG